MTIKETLIVATGLLIAFSLGVMFGARNVVDQSTDMCADFCFNYVVRHIDTLCTVRHP